MKQLLKQLLTLLHIAVTRNQKYDAWTRGILKSVLKPGAGCIDIGCHKGEILDLMLASAPGGKMYGFEPIPELYGFLKQKYAGINGVEIMPVALYDSKGTTSFQHVVSDPAYSGLRKRRYAKPDTEIRQITVETALLDDIIPETYQADLIKIDVEGAEFHVMKGAEKTIKRCKPIIIFEFGLGAADFYGSCPDALYDFLVAECGMKLSTLKSFLDRGQFLRREEFKTIYEQGLEYYFVASA